MNLQNCHPRFVQFFNRSDDPTKAAILALYAATDASDGEYARLYTTMQYAATAYGYNFTP